MRPFTDVSAPGRTPARRAAAKHLAAVFALLSFALVAFGTASAENPLLPVEWEGVWSIADSSYNCATDQFTGYEDGHSTTFCGGGNATGLSNCNGTADATSIHVTCTSGGVLFPGCNSTTTTQVDNIRTGNTFRMVTTVTVTYSGTGGCDQIPASCTRLVSYGTRTGPPAPGFCLTAVRKSSWGRLKILYR